MDDYTGQASNEDLDKLAGLQSSASEIDAGILKTKEIDNKIELEPSKNMFNKESVVIGKYMQLSGVDASNITYDYSQTINIEPNTEYFINKRLRFVTYYDIDGMVLGGVENLSNESFTPPIDVFSIIITIYHEDLDTGIQLEKGSVGTLYSSYGGKLNENLADNIVGVKQTNFMRVGKNLFNIDKVSDGYYMTETGVDSANTLYSFSEMIKVIQGESYCLSESARFTTYFDNIGNIILGGSNTTISGKIVIPLGVEFIVITAYNTSIDRMQFELGSVSTEYESYGYELHDSQYPIRLPTVKQKRAYLTISPKQYVIDGFDTNFYNENIVENFARYKGRNSIDVSLTSTRYRETSVSTKIIDLATLENTNYEGNVTVVSDEFDSLEEKQFQFFIADKTNNTPVIIQNIGDSYSGRMTWANVILNDITANVDVTFIGLRNANTAPIMCDAQGGWTLNHFFTVDPSGVYSQFMQPTLGSYLYYGMTRFWIDANSEIPSYGADYFDDVKGLFDSVTGLKLSPNIGDIMHDGTDYIEWDGSAWTAILEATFGGFAFNFGKYRTAWSKVQPDILNVLLGTNDFASTTESGFDTDFVEYKALYEELITSVHSDSPSTKIVIGVPVSSGRQGEHGTLLTEKRKRGYFLLADAINTSFSDREDELIYIVDYHSVVDRVYGYDRVSEVPFDTYDGTIISDNSYAADVVHLGDDGFEQMGNAYMAVIQHLR